MQGEGEDKHSVYSTQLDHELLLACLEILYVFSNNGKDAPGEKVQKHKSQSLKLISKGAFHNGWRKSIVIGISLLFPKITYKLSCKHLKAVSCYSYLPASWL